MSRSISLAPNNVPSRTSLPLNMSEPTALGKRKALGQSTKQHVSSEHETYKKIKTESEHFSSLVLADGKNNILPNSSYGKPWRGLPGELRNRIYTLAATSVLRRIVRLSKVSEVDEDIPLTSSPSSLGLLLCCKEAYEIVLPLIHETPLHVVGTPYTILQLLTSCPLDQRHHIADLRIKWQGNFRDEPDLKKTMVDLYHLFTTGMRLQALSLHYRNEFMLERRLQIFFANLGQAIVEHRLPRVRFCFPQISPDRVESWAGAYEIQQILREEADCGGLIGPVLFHYEVLTGVDVVMVERQQWIVNQMSRVAGVFPVLQAPEEERALDREQKRCMFPFTIETSQARDGEEGMVVEISNTGAQAARERLCGFERKVGGGSKFEAELRKARAALDAYTIFLAKHNREGPG